MIHQIEMLLGFFGTHSLLDELVVQHLDDSHPGSTGTKCQETLLSNRLSRNVKRAQNTSQRDDASSLNVIVKRQNPILILVQNLGSRTATKVLKMQQALGKQFFNRGNESINIRKVSLTAQTLVPHPQIFIIGQQLLIICPCVNYNRQYLLRINAGCCRIDHQLANRDVHAVNAPVADPQNAFCVSNHDQTNIPLISRILQALFNRIWIIHRQIGGILRLHEPFIIAFDSFGNYGIIDDRHKFINMPNHQIEKQRPIMVEDLH